MGQGSSLGTLWFTEEQECDGRKALLGMVEMTESGAPADRGRWSKLALYEDDGWLAVSDGTEKNKLAFDTAKSVALEFDVFLTLNWLFAQAGKNFNTDEVWEKTAPTLLKNVPFGGGTVNNVAVTKTGESTEYALPCTEFTMVAENGPGEMKICVAKPGGKLPQPFVVHFGIGDQMEAKLVKVSNERHSAPFYPQCLEPVKCEEVPELSPEEVGECRAMNGTMQPERDERNCLIGHRCKTMREMVLEDFARSQRPGCPSPEGLVQKAVECRNSPNPNLDFIQGDDGCISEVNCFAGQSQPPQRPQD